MNGAILKIEMSRIGGYPSAYTELILLNNHTVQLIEDGYSETRLQTENAYSTTEDSDITTLQDVQIQSNRKYKFSFNSTEKNEQVELLAKAKNIKIYFNETDYMRVRFVTSEFATVSNTRLYKHTITVVELKTDAVDVIDFLDSDTVYDSYTDDYLHKVRFYIAATRGVVVGSKNFSAGYTFANHVVFVNDLNHNIILNGYYANTQAIVDDFNVQMSGWGFDIESFAAGDNVGFRTLYSGRWFSFEFLSYNGPPPALPILGIAYGKYTGTGGIDTDFSILKNGITYYTILNQMYSIDKQTITQNEIAKVNVASSIADFKGINLRLYLSESQRNNIVRYMPRCNVEITLANGTVYNGLELVIPALVENAALINIYAFDVKVIYEKLIT